MGDVWMVYDLRMPSQFVKSQHPRVSTRGGSMCVQSDLENLDVEMRASLPWIAIVSTRMAF